MSLGHYNHNLLLRGPNFYTQNDILSIEYNNDKNKN